MDEGHILMVRSLEPLNHPVLMDTGGAMDRGPEKHQDGTVVVDRMGKAFAVEVIGDIHRTDVSKTFAYLKNGIVADGSAASFLWKRQKPVARG
jgi:hypothetical protein